MQRWSSAPSANELRPRRKYGPGRIIDPPVCFCLCVCVCVCVCVCMEYLYCGFGFTTPPVVLVTSSTSGKGGDFQAHKLSAAYVRWWLLSKVILHVPNYDCTKKRQRKRT